MTEQNSNQTPAPAGSTPAAPGNQTEARANITIPNETFEVEEGLPDLPSGGRTGQSKYSPLITQAKALQSNQKFRVPLNGVPADAWCRNVRLAIKKANLSGVKVTAVKGEDAAWAWVYKA